MARSSRTFQGSMPEVPVKFDSFALKGGLDLHTPQLSLKPGVARDSKNYECSINGGYTRIKGYERFDGRPSPTDAVYGTIAVSAVAGIVVGDTVNGATSGATGVVAAIDITSVPGVKIVAYTKSTGTFAVAENLRKVVTVIGVINTVGVAISDQVVIATYQLAAANIYRADIGVVPGSGTVLGGFSFGANKYAFRNNAGGTAAVLFKSSAAGWVAVPMPYEVAFTVGSGTAPAEGATITKGGVSAVVRRVMIQSGTFASNTAQGKFIIDLPTGGSFSAGAFTAGVTATCSGAQVQVSFLPSGRFETHTANAGNGVRVYGCDGVNRGWEFDGTYLCPITTGNTIDAPLHLRVHKKYLWFSFISSAQYSGVGAPYTWTIISGAGEIALDEAITGFLIMPGNETTAAMAILSVNGVSILYGNSSAEWRLTPLNAGVGSKAYSQQALSRAFIYDNLGIVSIDAVQSYGNFTANTLTVNLRSFVQARRTLITDSLINREKSQYRVYFSDGYALYCTVVNGKYIGSMPIFFTNPVAVAWAGDPNNGGEISYFGSTNGMVYRMDVGTSFDGGPMDWYCDLAFASQGNSRVLKRYRRAVVEVQGEGYAAFNVGYTLSYGNVLVNQGLPQDNAVTVSVTPVYWDSFTWDNFIWDGRSIAPVQIQLTGTSENIALRFEGSSALWPSHTLNSLTLHYTPRRVLRD